VDIGGVMINRRISNKLGEKLDPFPLHIPCNRLIYENVASLSELFTQIDGPHLLIEWN
jgi:hypothetical protein